MKYFFASLTAILFSSTFVFAQQEVPFINNDPIVNKKIDFEMFDFISKTLGASRMGEGMKCTIRVKNSRYEAKFSTGTAWVELLEVDYNDNGYDSGQKLKFKIPMGAKYGVKRSTNHWSGIGEDVKIELGDYYDHWLKFTHDGRGRILQLNVGNRLTTAPCAIRGY